MLSLSTTKPCLVYCKLCDCISGDGEVSVLPVLLTDSVSSLEESRAVVIGILTLLYISYHYDFHHKTDTQTQIPCEKAISGHLSQTQASKCRKRTKMRNRMNSFSGWMASFFCLMLLYKINKSCDFFFFLKD